MASPTEDSGQFGIGTFDNAEFDTIEQPSTVNVSSNETRIINLTNNVASTVNVFSDLGKEIRRDLISFVGTVQSEVDAQKQILRKTLSNITVFSTSDFRLGKKVISSLNVFSTTDRTGSFLRNPFSNIKSISKTRIIFELTNISNINVFTTNSFERIFNRFTQSSLKVQSKIKDILRSAPDLSPPFFVDVKQSYRTFIQVKQSFRTFIEDKT